MGNISVLRDKCNGCEQCIGVCPFGAIRIVGSLAEISETCTLCGACVESCSTQAIELKREQVAVDSTVYSGVWVVAEQSEGQVKAVSYELLGEARRLADKLSCRVGTILLGENVDKQAQTLISYGADEVYVVNGLTLRLFNDESYSGIVVDLIRRYKPEIVLIGATAYGRSLAPRVASRLDTGLTADCTILAIDMEKRLLLQTRPAFGGNLMATIICPHRRPQMATVRPRVMKALEPDMQRRGKVIVEQKSATATSTKVHESIKSVAENVNLADADIIVAAGSGIGSKENMALVADLARALGGVVGATRSVVDAGWISYGHQIGQTGKTVAPKLYIACGISGAVQHLAGMSSAQVVVAINKDPEAPIFKVAHYGIVGDVREVIPALIQVLTP